LYATFFSYLILVEVAWLGSVCITWKAG
jgi:hypothetical protein